LKTPSPLSWKESVSMIVPFIEVRSKFRILPAVYAKN